MSENYMFIKLNNFLTKDNKMFNIFVSGYKLRSHDV